MSLSNRTGFGRALAFGGGEGKLGAATGDPIISLCWRTGRGYVDYRGSICLATGEGRVGREERGGLWARVSGSVDSGSMAGPCRASSCTYDAEPAAAAALVTGDRSRPA